MIVQVNILMPRLRVILGNLLFPDSNPVTEKVTVSPNLDPKNTKELAFIEEQREAFKKQNGMTESVSAQNDVQVARPTESRKLSTK